MRRSSCGLALAMAALFGAGCGDSGTSSASSTGTGGAGTSGATTTTTTTTGGGGGGGNEGGAPPDIGACETGATPGPLNPPGTVISPTGTYTDWSWPSPPARMEWLLAIEQEPADDGYFWAHQFGFAGPGADGGYLGLQQHGAFQADPPSGPVEKTKMAVFSIAGASIAAELGDIAYPDARTYGDFDGGAGWNIHVKYDWVKCRPYRLEVGQNGTDDAGNLWYGGWVTDTVTHQKTYLGRILIPKDWGLLNTFSVMWTERFGYSALGTCADLQYSSVIFGSPSGDDGAITPTKGDDHFYNPPNCASSRFTDLDLGVRQEMGVP